MCRTFYGQGGKLGSGATLVGGLGCEFALAFMLHLSILWSMGKLCEACGACLACFMAGGVCLMHVNAHLR